MSASDLVLLFGRHYITFNYNINDGGRHGYDEDNDNNEDDDVDDKEDDRNDNSEVES